MWLLLIEVLLVLAILCGAVWWTMFAGRSQRSEPAAGEARDDSSPR
ncbi:MAG: hypothetical protein IT501_00520 [Rubrivivax sp.]|nr:hypothetical protein [Rubrivivax sp.]